MKTRYSILLAAPLGLAGLLACATPTGSKGEGAGSEAPVVAEQAQMGMGMGMHKDGEVCPMTVPGTTVTAAEPEGRAALTFVTTEAGRDELRTRVQLMSEMHNRRHADGGMMGGGTMDAGMAGGGMMGGGMMGGGMMGGGMMGGMRPPASVASVESIEGGARLVLQPEDPAQLDMLREHVRRRAARMARGECSMRPGGAAQAQSAMNGQGGEP